MSNFQKEMDDFARQQLQKLYDQCTPEQQAFFNRMYKSVQEIPLNKINWAAQQCERTIAKNNALTGETKEISQL